MVRPAVNIARTLLNYCLFAHTHRLANVFCIPGLGAACGPTAPLHGDDPLYLMRVPGAPDVRLIVRTGGPDGLPLLVEDVVQPDNMRKVFKAHNV